MRKQTFLTLLAITTVAALSSEARAQLLFDAQPAGTLGAQPCNGSGCWTNYARVVDVEGDGDLDLVGVNCGGFFSNPAPQPLAIWTNDGAGQFADASALLGSLNAAVRQVAFGDVDGDKDIDVFVPAAGSKQPDALFIRQAGGTFVNEAASRLPAALSSDAGATRFADVDNDGDLDLFIITGYTTNIDPAQLYLNDGTGKFALAAGALPTAKHGAVDPDDVDLADIDGDFDIDVYINMHHGQNLLWGNDGTGKFTDKSLELPALSVDANFHYGPVFCDVDGDGDRDLFVDNTADGYAEQLLINNGSGTFTDETNARVSGNIGADDNLVACIDYDDDGDLDFAVGALSPGRERVFMNDGTGKFNVVTGAFNGSVDPTLWMDFGDLNGDGRLDAFTAQGEGNPQVEVVYFGNTTVAADTRAPRIIATENVMLSPTVDTVLRFAVSDNAVTDDGPRLRRAWVKVGANEFDARFMGGDLYRAVIPPTSAAAFTVCATDWAGNMTPNCEATSGVGGGGAGGNGQGGGGQGGSGQGGSGNQGGAGSGGQGGAGQSGSGNQGSGGGNQSSASAGGEAGSGGGPALDEGGCGCSVPSGSPYGAAALLIGLAAAAARRRRRT